jgi:hypothetical protein
MGVGFKRRVPIKPSRVYDNPEIIEIFHRCNFLGYFERLKGYNDEVAIEFSHNFHNINEHEYVTIVRGITIRINEASIRKVSILPMGVPWEKYERQESINFKGHYSSQMKNMTRKKWH